jgi:hypothetical protein
MACIPAFCCGEWCQEKCWSRTAKSNSHMSECEVTWRNIGFGYAGNSTIKTRVYIIKVDLEIWLRQEVVEPICTYGGKANGSEVQLLSATFFSRTPPYQYSNMVSCDRSSASAGKLVASSNPGEIKIKIRHSPLNIKRVTSGHGGSITGLGVRVVQLGRVIVE